MIPKMKPLPQLMTSNAKKIKEYQRLGLPALFEGVSIDLPEVLADPIEVALQKAYMAGPNVIIEDTSLDIEGMDMGVNVRWMMDDIEAVKGRSAIFRVVLAHNDGEKVQIYVGEIHGEINSNPLETGGFGFDRFFYPHGAEHRSFFALELAGEKDRFSARALAVEHFKKGIINSERLISDFEPWTGSWQNEEPDLIKKPSASPKL